MAVLESIRKKGGIIVSVVIGIALLAFIIGDFVPKSNRNNYNIAEINGKTLVWQDYENKITELTNMYKQNTGQSSLDERTLDMVRGQAWEMMVREEIMKKEYEQTGLTVSPEELFDMIQGPNPNPRIRQYFVNQQTGEFDRSLLINFLKNKGNNPNDAQQWNLLEKSLLEERYVQKFGGLVSKGMYVPVFMGENENTEINKKVDFDYVVKQYTTIPDSAVKVTTADLKKYYEKNKKQWEQETSRDIEYVAFPIVPSQEDRTAADEWMAKIKPEFAQTENASQFVNMNSKVPFDGRFLTRDQLPVQAAELFDEEVGTVVGPYQEGEALKLVKTIKFENRPDSVKVRQIILLPKQQTQQGYNNAVALADSIKAAVEKGADFSALATKYSADPGVADTKGDIGWIREAEMQVGSMSETLFGMKKGEVSKMESQQGIFVVQVTERGKENKKVQIATLQHNIIPSTRTEQTIYSQASKFAVENRTETQFDASTGTQNITKRVASYIGENDGMIPGLSSGRQIVRWAYNAKKSEVSDVFTLEEAYVVAVLKNVRKKGIAPFEQVSGEIELAVRKEKKAEQIATSFSEAVKKAQSFSDLAVSLQLPVESASGIAFSAFSVPNAGVEPQLIAAAASEKEGGISQPIEGINGVYLITVKQIIEPEEGALEQAKERLASTYDNRSISESVQALRKAAEIKDMRSKFY